MLLRLHCQWMMPGRVIVALKRRFPEITGPKKDDICYATQNRQDAVKLMVKQCDLVIVVGSPNSSNSNRLCEVARNAGVDAYMIDRAEQLEEKWLHEESSDWYHGRGFRTGDFSTGSNLTTQAIWFRADSRRSECAGIKWCS